jgi:hypothetical protein
MVQDSLGLRDLDLRLGYDAADEALRHFYVPALSRSVRYDRSVGYFKASAFSVAARGLSRFISGGGTARFLVGAEVGEADREALIGATEVPPELAARLAASLVPSDEIARHRFEVLAWLVREGRLELRVAVAVDRGGVPVALGENVPYFHEKIGILHDVRGDGVAFQGSVNESATGWSANFESFSVYRSWDTSAAYFDMWARKFEERWAGEVPGFRVFPLPEALAAAFVRMAPAETPPVRDVEEGTERADRRTLARFLLAAPRLLGAESLAEATSGVTLFPHQRKVAERLAGEYPRSWLVADEVGLGKTISAGLAMRRLVLTGDAKRVLILAPANVCNQWQDELFEKFGLWVPRLEAGRLWGAHPDDVRSVPAGANPYEAEPVLMVSSHLARRPQHRQQILVAPRYDLLIVDEAHHARRRGADLDEYRPSRLLQLLDEVTRTDHARAVWLLTATPMQVHPIELIDLLRHVGLSGALERYDDFARYFAELAGDDDEATNWGFLAAMLTGTSSLPFDAADHAVLERMRAELGPVQQDRLQRFARPGEDVAALIEGLGAGGRRRLRAWLRHRSPVGQLVTRHTRTTLRRYRDAGLLDEPVADRMVSAIVVSFTKAEQALYDDLDDLLDRLMAAHGTRRGAGFVLTIYRRRLTSSWAAIRRTLQRRLDRERLWLELDLLDDAVEEELDTGDGGTVDDGVAVPLTEADLAEIENYLQRLERVPDSKFDRLCADLDAARGSGRAVIVFTQFTDTLDYLRDRLHASYRSHLATFAGSGGQQWAEDAGWVRVSKAELVEALMTGRVSVLLATDAASEGLNLQAASALVNYDLPWNPMRVEQRIGRIDRIGQPAPVVTIANYVVPGTVEESVYSALAERIDLFSGLLGQLQPILGATDDAFRKIFRSPRSERAAAEKTAIAELMAKAGELERSGLDLGGDEDPLPEPQYNEAPVGLVELQRCVTDELDITLDRPGRPTASGPALASRDPERWAALTTYGHPDLEPALRRIAGADHLEGGDDTLVLRELKGRWIAFRADRTPPLRARTLASLTDLGPPVAASEADTVARAVLESEVAALHRRRQELFQARRQRWDADVRRRFRLLVAQAVPAESELRLRRDGEAPEPRLVWMDLGLDQVSGWHNAELFRQHLGLSLTELLPSVPAGVDERPDRVLARVRADTGQALVDLIVEWRDTALPGRSSS